MKKLGFGIQEFLKFKKNNLIYVDKTKDIYPMVNDGGYYFLSRPRRFGKSLLVNTMKELFLGNKHLFEGTWIYNNWNFEDKYPVIQLGLASLAYDGLGLERVLSKRLKEIAEAYNVTLDKAENYTEEFKQLIMKLGKKQSVVILIDEYDKPIIDYIEESKGETAYKNREILKNFYSVIKDCDKYIKLLFITGVSKFSKVSFFSELNNLNDITISEDYATITGYTEKEIENNYAHYLQKLEKKFKIDKKKLLQVMGNWYDGYSWDGDIFVYNPFSIINLFSNKEFDNYWFKTGTPTFLTKLIKEKSIDVKEFETSLTIKKSIFDSYELNNIDLKILLFQAGYLTIKKKIVNSEDFSISYRLAYPNKEVENSFYDYLIGEFTDIDKTDFFELTNALQDTLEENSFDKFIVILKSIYANIPSTIFIKEREYYYHTIIYLILKLMKVNIIDVEKYTNHGRIDTVIYTKKYIYIIEFKMSNANTALKQIKDKKYYEPYQSDGREIFCAGVAFDDNARNIKEYKVKTVNKLLEIK